MSRTPTQFKYWMVTLWEPDWEPEIFCDDLAWIKGQKEKAPSTGNLHWQLIMGFKKRVTKTRILQYLKDKYGEADMHFWGNIEPTRSDAADRYVWKEETAIPDTKFELGR